MQVDNVFSKNIKNLIIAFFVIPQILKHYKF